MLGQRYKHLKLNRHRQSDKASIVVQFVGFLKVENVPGHQEESMPTIRNGCSFGCARKSARPRASFECEE